MLAEQIFDNVGPGVGGDLQGVPFGGGLLGLGRGIERGDQGEDVGQGGFGPADRRACHGCDQVFEKPAPGHWPALRSKVKRAAWSRSIRSSNSTAWASRAWCRTVRA